MRQKNEVHLKDIKNVESVLNSEDEALLAVSLALIPLIDDDIYLAFAVDLIYLHEAQHADTGSSRDLLKYEASFGGVVNVLFVEILKLSNGLERLFEKVVHRLVVVVELVKEGEVGLLKCPQLKVSSFDHNVPGGGWLRGLPLSRDAKRSIAYLMVVGVEVSHAARYVESLAIIPLARAPLEGASSSDRYAHDGTFIHHPARCRK